MNIEEFAGEVGPIEAGPVWIRGHETRRRVIPGLRSISAPQGIMSLRADEMILECGAGTPIDDVMTAAAKVGQYVNLPVATNGSGTVGGALAMGHHDVRRLGRGPIRDGVLRIRFVGHDGEVVVAGGSTVKNVSGFDLCRLMVGSRGSLGFIGEVLLRTRPLPPYSCWFGVEAHTITDVMFIVQCLYRPAAVLWNGATLLVCLEGHQADISAAVTDVRDRTGVVLRENMAPDLEDFPHQSFMAPARIPEVIAHCEGRCWAEIGVGTGHFMDEQPAKKESPGVAIITKRLLTAFDPTGRLNPGHGLSQGAVLAH